MDMAELSSYDLWIAQYANGCSYSGAFGIWQYKGNIPDFTGYCNGVSGACDLNVAYNDKTTYRKEEKEIGKI